MGGLGILNPSVEADFDYANSRLATKQLGDAIFNQHHRLNIDREEHDETMKEIKSRKLESYKTLNEKLSGSLSDKMIKLIHLASEKGASCWLTSLPLVEYGFRLNKEEFVDAICLRYDLMLKEVPRSCICGDTFSINHCTRITCKMRFNTCADNRRICS